MPDLIIFSTSAGAKADFFSLPLCLQSLQRIPQFCQTLVFAPSNQFDRVAYLDRRSVQWPRQLFSRGSLLFCSWPEMQDMFHSVSVIANVFVIRATKTLSVMYLTVVVGRTCPVFPSCLARYLIISGVNCMTSCRCSRATAWPMTCCIAPRFSECAV